MPSSRILLVHNSYQQAGGEDEAVRAEAAMLRAFGHAVREYHLDNAAIEGMSRVRLIGATLWNTAAVGDIGRLLDATPVDIAHFHNTFPLISPAGYYAARRRAIPVVQTLHNYRLLCPNALLYRDGHACEDCLGKPIPWPGVVHRCYRDSFGASLAVASMLTLHRGLRTWTRMVDVFIALSEFARAKFIEGGLPADRIVVKPNFLPADPGEGGHEGRYFLFVGRLSDEKGLKILTHAWRKLATTTASAGLKIVGTGPLHGLADEPLPGVEWLGWQPKHRVLDLMRDALALVLPSTCYENFPLTVAEAFATGLPVLASRHGSTQTIVRDFETGRLFRAGDPTELAAVIAWTAAHRDAVRRMQALARREYENNYTAARNHEELLKIYTAAARRRASAARFGDEVSDHELA